MGKLTDILSNGSGDGNIHDLWNSTEAAREYSSLPAGTYNTRIIEGALFKSRSGTPGYKLTFQISDGPFAGRRIWLDLWLTAAALPMTKRDLTKIGLVALEHLERPVPQGIWCEVKVVLQKSDAGAEFNVIREFKVVGADPPDPYSPTPVDSATVAQTAAPPEVVGPSTEGL